MSRHVYTAVLVTLAALLAGCSSNEPSAPGDVSTLSGDVQPIFDSRCASQQCHGAEEDADLRLTSGDSHGELVNVPSIQVPSLMRVLPSEPDSSYLVLKIGDSPPQGNRMPIGQAPLTTTDVSTIRSWIDNGALDN